MQLEKDFSKKNRTENPFVEYTKQELAIIKNFRGFFFDKNILKLNGRLCWAGSKYFVINERGEAWRCYPAKKYRNDKGYLGNLLKGTFKLSKRPSICQYKYCSCVNPITLGMLVGNIKKDNYK